MEITPQIRRSTGPHTQQYAPDFTTYNILVIDTGGGHISTITKSSCLVLHRTGHWTENIGYQDKSCPKRHPIVHCAIKVTAPNIDQPIILVLNYVSLLEA